MASSEEHAANNVRWRVFGRTRIEDLPGRLVVSTTILAPPYRREVKQRVRSSKQLLFAGFLAHSHAN